VAAHCLQPLESFNILPVAAAHLRSEPSTDADQTLEHQTLEHQQQQQPQQQEQEQVTADTHSLQAVGRSTASSAGARCHAQPSIELARPGFLSGTAVVPPSVAQQHVLQQLEGENKCNTHAAQRVTSSTAVTEAAASPAILDHTVVEHSAAPDLQPQQQQLPEAGHHDATKACSTVSTVISSSVPPAAGESSAKGESSARPTATSDSVGKRLLQLQRAGVTLDCLEAVGISDAAQSGMVGSTGTQLDPESSAFLFSDEVRPLALSGVCYVCFYSTGQI
jgi:hypothetical protein